VSRRQANISRPWAPNSEAGTPIIEAICQPWLYGIVLLVTLSLPLMEKLPWSKSGGRLRRTVNSAAMWKRQVVASWLAVLEAWAKFK
jgi:hypothetical protein